jgi:glycosyltransferase involved in cell wall biosynthesis
VDASPALVEAAAIRDPRIRLLKSPARGLVAALNAGLAECRAPWIARMDADDRCLPRRLECQLGFAQVNPETEVMGCLVRFGGDRMASAGYARHVDWVNAQVTEDEIRSARFADAPFAHPSVMFRRTCPERWGGYRDGPFPEDFELWLRWTEAGARLAKVAEALLVWNDPPDRLSRTDTRYDAEAFFRIKAPYLAAELSRVRRGRPVWVWGAGRPTRKRVAYLEAEGVEIAGYIDVDPRKIGGRIGERRVLGPDQIPHLTQAFVLTYVASIGARAYAARVLEERGFGKGRDYLPCA